MPVLAGHFEAAGIPTVVVTMMPELAARLLTPRILGIEFPYAHSFGAPGDRATQRIVLEAALVLLAGAAASGTRVDLDLRWPEARGRAFKAWQPAQPSPIVALMLAERKPS